MKPLSPRARAYLDAFEAAHVAPTSAPPLRPLRPSASRSRLLLPFAILGAAAVAVLAFALRAAPWTAVSADEQRRYDRASYDDERENAEAEATAPAPGRIEAPQSPRVPAVVPPEAEPEPEPPASVAPAPKPKTFPKRSADLVRELALLDAARAALSRGDETAARRHLRTHARRFKRGMLAPERRALLQQIGDVTETPRGVHSSGEPDSP